MFSVRIFAFLLSGLREIQVLFILSKFILQKEPVIFYFLTPVIGIGATIFAVSSTVPQIVKGLKTKKMDDVSIWLIMALIAGLSLWVIYGIAKSDIVIAGGNSVGVILNLILLLLKLEYSRNPIS